MGGRLDCAADILEHEQVTVLDVDNGARFETYAIVGAPGEICLNGAAARLVHVGDTVILLTYGDTDLYSSGAINAIHTFESMARFLNGELIGIVHASLDEAGEAAQHAALLEQAYRLGWQLALGQAAKS